MPDVDPRPGGDPADALRALLASSPVRWSVVVRELGGPVLLAHEPDRVLPSASIGKILLLLAVADALEGGRLDPDARLAVAPQDAVADSGLLRHLRGRDLPVVDHAALVGAVSDNLSTNVLLRTIGREQVAELARGAGVVGVELHDRVRDARGPDDPPYLSTSCAAGLAALVAGIAAGSLLSPRVCARVADWLRLDTDTSMVAGALGLDPLCHVDRDRGLRLWHKTGTNLGVRADAGVVEGGRGVAYAALARWPAGDDAGPARDEVLATMGAIGRVVRTLAAPGVAELT